MITVVNKHTHTPTPNDVYIGRGSALGNPYSHLQGTKAAHICASRAEAVQFCKGWLEDLIRHKEPRVCAELNRIYTMAKRGDVNLVCYCAPKACHGGVIKELIENHIN